MSVPSVYVAIAAVTAELSQRGVPKSRLNEADDYRYRSIDDLMKALSPLLSKHRLCVLRDRVGERLEAHVHRGSFARRCNTLATTRSQRSPA